MSIGEGIAFCIVLASVFMLLDQKVTGALAEREEERHDD